MRILVLGAGVIGSVYAGRLQEAGHDVVLMARGQRLADLRAHGLVLLDAETGHRTELSVASVSEPGPDDRFELVLVPVRAEQLDGTLAALSAMTDGSDVLFFGNTAGRQTQLVDALGERALFGFPAAGGTRDGPAIKYVLVAQQKTMLGEPDGSASPRIHELQRVFEHAGFSTRITTDIGGWLLGHAAFVVPFAYALYRVDVDARRLAGDRATMRLMVRATSQAFTALRDVAEIPTNLRVLFRLPTILVTTYWRRVLAGPRGELWFGGHSRAAPEEMHALAEHLQQAVRSTGRATPDLDRLLSTRV